MALAKRFVFVSRCEYHLAPLATRTDMEALGSRSTSVAVRYDLYIYMLNDAKSVSSTILYGVSTGPTRLRGGIWRSAQVFFLAFKIIMLTDRIIIKIPQITSFNDISQLIYLIT